MRLAVLHEGADHVRGAEASGTLRASRRGGRTRRRDSHAALAPRPPRSRGLPRRPSRGRLLLPRSKRPASSRCMTHIMAVCPTEPIAIHCFRRKPSGVIQPSPPCKTATWPSRIEMLSNLIARHHHLVSFLEAAHSQVRGALVAVGQHKIFECRRQRVWLGRNHHSGTVDSRNYWKRWHHAAHPIDDHAILVV